MGKRAMCDLIVIESWSNPFKQISKSQTLVSKFMFGLDKIWGKCKGKYIYIKKRKKKNKRKYNIDLKWINYFYKLF